MARPETFNDIPLDERNEQIGSFSVGKLSTAPTLLKHYATFIEAVEKAGGHVVPNKWNNSDVDIFIPKSHKLLEYRLMDLQDTWDRHKKLYERAAVRDETGDELKEWERENVVKFAEKEGLPNPYDVFAANDDELDQIRKELLGNKS